MIGSCVKGVGRVSGKIEFQRVRIGRTAAARPVLLHPGGNFLPPGIRGWPAAGVNGTRRGESIVVFQD